MKKQIISTFAVLAIFLTACEQETVKPITEASNKAKLTVAAGVCFDDKSLIPGQQTQVEKQVLPINQRAEDLSVNAE